MKRKTKIVATISSEILKGGLLGKMVETGVDVFRLNFSYGDHREHGNIIDAIKGIRNESLRPIAIMQDLSGSRIRVGEFVDSEVELISGDVFTLSTDQGVLGDKSRVSVDCPPDIVREFREGDRITISDAEVELVVSQVGESELTCYVSRGGKVRSGRGIAIPGKDISLPSLTDKDINDLEFGLAQGVDFVALSFVRSAEDVLFLRSFINEKADADRRPEIVAKIETLKAVENFEEILKVADGVMVARGDLASEVDPEEVPLLQKSIIRSSNLAGKPVITATQMLESMVNSPVPTRAETSDVANAIIDGTDAVMLSAETAIGRYPLSAVKVMATTSMKIEANYFNGRLVDDREKEVMDTVDSVTAAAVKVSRDLGTGLIVAITESGFTGRMISRHRPNVPIVAMTANERTFFKLSLSFGCVPMLTERTDSLEKAFDLVREYVSRNTLAGKGERVVVAAGVPFNHPDAGTNMLFVERL